MILIVEDQDILLGYLTRCATIAAPSLPVRTATNAVDALQIVRDHAAELRLVLLDAHMPVLDGRVAAVLIRQLAPHAWILPCTGDMSAVAMFIHVGCTDVIVKPLPPAEQMVARIQSLLNGPLPEPLSLPLTDPVFALAQVQFSQVSADVTRQPHLYRALLNPLNQKRPLLAVPKTIIEQVVSILRAASEKFGGNRLLGRSIKMLTDIDQPTTTHTAGTLPHV